MPLNIIVKSPINHREILRQVRDQMRREYVERNRRFSHGGGWQRMARAVEARKEAMRSRGGRQMGFEYAGSVPMAFHEYLADAKVDGRSDWYHNYDLIKWMGKQEETKTIAETLKHGSKT